MKLKRAISLLLLTVYSIVLAHNFVPHHHHFDFSSAAETGCYAEKEESQCCSDFALNDSGHKNHSHDTCNFNEKTIIAKTSYLSFLYLPASQLTFSFSGFEKQSYFNSTSSFLTPGNYPLQIKLRGPPSIA